MNQVKKVLNHVFIDGLGGMTWGLFATLIVGTILQQIGTLIGGDIGQYFFLTGKVAAMLTGAGIGIGVAAKYKESVLVTVSAAVAGMAGAFASQILSGAILVDGAMIMVGPGEPIGAFLAVLAGVTIGHLVSGKTKIDILVTPLVTITVGTAAGLLVGPGISRFLQGLGAIVNWGTEQQPFIMGIVLSVVMGMVLTAPTSSAALAIMLNLSGLAAGAATIGCCCNMVGFAVASFRENKFGGLVAQGLGTSMLQMPNIFKKPLIWTPAIISSAILGPVGIMVFGMTNNATGAGMGTAGLVGQLMTLETMTATEPFMMVLLKILLLHVILPAILTLLASEWMRKRGLIKLGDMKLEL